MKTIGGVIAGGHGRRMPVTDKPFARLGGQALIAHVISRLEPQVDSLVINANDAPDRFVEFGLDVVADQIKGYRGPLAGVHALMSAALVRNASHVLVVPTDTPFLPSDLFSRLSTAHSNPSITRISRSGGRRHSVVALWPAELADSLATHLTRSDDLSMAAWLGKIDCIDVDFDKGPGLDPFFNINSPADLARAETIMADDRQIRS